MKLLNLTGPLTKFNGTVVDPQHEYDEKSNLRRYHVTVGVGEQKNHLLVCDRNLALTGNQKAGKIAWGWDADNKVGQTKPPLRVVMEGFTAEIR